MSPRRAKAIGGRDGDPAVTLREHLIDAAERLLAERRTVAVTTRDIARAAGVSDGVLYNHFAGKDDLLLAALLRRYGRLLADFRAGLPAPGTGGVEANLAAHLRAALDLSINTFPAGAGLLAEPALLHRFVVAIHQPPFAPQQFLQPLTDYIAGEQRLGRLRAGDPEPVVTLLTGVSLVLAATSLMSGRPPEDVAASIPAVVRALVDGAGPD